MSIDKIPRLNNLSRTEARAVEQTLINRHGLEKDGGSLLNKINSIARDNPLYDAAVARGADLLGKLGL